MSCGLNKNNSTRDLCIVQKQFKRTCRGHPFSEKNSGKRNMRQCDGDIREHRTGIMLPKDQNKGKTNQHRYTHVHLYLYIHLDRLTS